MKQDGFKTVKEVSELAGVSIRTLHYYDEIGLLHATQLTDAGYRLYSEENLLTLQQILFLKEMGFELKKIKEIMENEHYDQAQALMKQRKLLKLKEERIQGIIKLIDAQLENKHTVDLTVFNKKEIENMQNEYEKEARERWGSSEAYKQSEKKTKAYTKEDWNKVTEEANTIFKAFAQHVGEPVESNEVQQLVGAWQKHISKYFYDCTLEILEGLGMMYVQDERFMNNIDAHGTGTAKLMSEGIAYYCSK